MGPAYRREDSRTDCKRWRAYLKTLILLGNDLAIEDKIAFTEGGYKNILLAEVVRRLQSSAAIKTKASFKATFPSSWKSATVSQLKW
ncbi:putative CI repressor [Salmonella phage 19]|nr:putative CI repressor [Salmonella phage 19]